MSTHGRKGYNAVIKVGGEDVGHARECTPNYLADLVETTSKDTGGWKTKEQGLKDWSMGIVHLFVPDNAAQAAVQDAYMAGTKVTVLWTDEDGNGMQGLAIVVGWTPGGQNMTDAMIVTVALEGDGKPSELGAVS